MEIGLLVFQAAVAFALSFLGGALGGIWIVHKIAEPIKDEDIANAVRRHLAKELAEKRDAP